MGILVILKGYLLGFVSGVLTIAHIHVTPYSDLALGFGSLERKDGYIVSIQVGRCPKTRTKTRILQTEPWFLYSRFYWTLQADCRILTSMGL